MDTIIILDINNNRYLALDALGATVWERLKADGLISDETTSAGMRDQLNYLLEETLVVSSSHNVTRVKLQNKAGSVPFCKAQFNLDGGAFSLTACLALIKALLVYNFQLKKMPVKAALEFLQQRKKENSRKNVADIAATLSLYKLARKIYKYGSRDCFPRSFILCLALAYQGVDADMMIGIENFPFKAHAWVQINDRVINDTINNLQNFQVIAAF